MHQGIFKAYDVRGIVPREVDEAVAEAVGEAVGRHLGRGHIVVGRDARLSSPALERAVRRGLRKAGVRARAVPVGITTTPMFYFLVNRLKAAGGIMVTASHNPKEHNGFKIVGEGAVPISGREVYGWVKEGVRSKNKK